MRVCLFWNPTAGGGASLDTLTSAMTRAGHEVVRVVSRPEELSIEHTQGVDCVAAAGGDGTVARAGRMLAGGSVPLAILPLGTANNIATSLGVDGQVDDVIARWADRKIVRVDVGTLGGKCFLESVGCGLVTSCIEEGGRSLSKADPEEHLAAARQLYLDQLKNRKPARYTITMDDETVEGDYLLVEALNTAQVGPGIGLASNVSSVDGLLSVVALGEEDRPALIDYITALRDGESPAAPFHAWRTRHVEIRGTGHVHLDDLVISDASQPFSIDVKAGDLPIVG
ncbi:MAG TPA: diacylglycerol kinase family protein [Vicinamibacterales bacterium]|nr:diacylglycerol kinase family protein [Vicinamibacterales bacterium]